MRNFKHMKKLLILMLLINWSVNILALENLIVKHRGNVFLNREKIKQSNFKFSDRGIIKTGANSSAYLKLFPKIKIIVKENTSFSIRGKYSSKLNIGRIAFNMKNRANFKKSDFRKKQVRTYKIRTLDAEIMIKGTSFIVARKDNQLRVYLEQGNLKLVALNKGFYLYTEELLNQFEDYQNKVKTDFKKFTKSEQNKYENFAHSMKADFVKKVELDSGKAIRLSKNILIPIKFSSEVKKELKELKEFISGEEKVLPILDLN